MIGAKKFHVAEKCQKTISMVLVRAKLVHPTRSERGTDRIGDRLRSKNARHADISIGCPLP
jgi:hypothetical protein